MKDTSGREIPSTPYCSCGGQNTAGQCEHVNTVAPSTPPAQPAPTPHDIAIGRDEAPDYSAEPAQTGDAKPVQPSRGIVHLGPATMDEIAKSIRGIAGRVEGEEDVAELNYHAAQLIALSAHAPQAAPSSSATPNPYPHNSVERAIWNEGYFASTRADIEEAKPVQPWTSRAYDAILAFDDVDPDILIRAKKIIINRLKEEGMMTTPQEVERVRVWFLNAHASAEEAARFGVGPHLLTARNGEQALCGGPGVCPACMSAEKAEKYRQLVDAANDADVVLTTARDEGVRISRLPETIAKLRSALDALREGK